MDVVCHHEWKRRTRDRDDEVADDTEVIRDDSAGHRGWSHGAVIGSVLKPVEDVSFSMSDLIYKLSQVELEEEINYSNRGGVLGTVLVDIEVTKDD